MKVIKSKKGAGIELAIFMLVIVFAFCTLIISVAYSVSLSKHKEFNDLKTKTTLDRLGEAFIQNQELSVPENYEYDIDGRDKLTIFDSTTKETLFIVELDNAGNVTRWQYFY